MSRSLMRTCMLALVFAAGHVLGATRDGPEALGSSDVAVGAGAQGVDAQPMRVFELRTYTAPEGRLEPLLARFRDHTLRIFERHGMTNVGYWVPQEAPLSGNTLIYLLAHPSREAADASWRAFAADPEWQRVAEESQRDGRLIEGLVRVYLGPTDFSPMR